MTKELTFFQTEIKITPLADPSFPSKDFLPPFLQEDVPLVEKIPLSTVESEEQKQEEENEEEWKETVLIDQHIQQHIKKVIEALLFTSPEPLSLAKIREITDSIYPLRPRHLRQLIDTLKQEYISQQRSFKLEEIAHGYALRTHEEYAPYLELLHRQRRGEKLSHAGTEVLAIIAYRQPITRPQIDAIRGVDSSGTLMQLLERQLVEPVGKLEAPGRPTLYGTTKEFLKHFGLKNLMELKNK